jgi:hypothetical protein
MPALNTQIKALFGFDFTKLLEEMGSKKKRSAKRSGRKKAVPKKGAKKIGKTKK